MNSVSAHDSVIANREQIPITLLASAAAFLQVTLAEVSIIGESHKLLNGQHSRSTDFRHKSANRGAPNRVPTVSP